MKLVDKYGRIHNYLRISLTDKCNLRCAYCMPHEDMRFFANSKLMTAGEIGTIAKEFVSLGVDKIRLTGGEPLLRPDAGEILEALAALPVRLALTTNATHVHEFISSLEKAQLKSINVSLDTLDAEKFFKITRRDLFDVVYANIMLLIEKGFNVKVNMVVMKGVNDDEVVSFAALTKEYPLEIRFIEFMPFAGNEWLPSTVVPWQEIAAQLSIHYNLIERERPLHSTTQDFEIEGHVGSIGFISTMTKPFCGDCNRLRLTADGKMKNCLFSREETDLLGALRSGKSITPLILETVTAKHAELGGQINAPLPMVDADDIVNRSMIQIGG